MDRIRFTGPPDPYEGLSTEPAAAGFETDRKESPFRTRGSNPSKNRRRMGWFIGAGIILALLLTFLLMSLYSSWGIHEDYIGVLYVEGEISGSANASNTYQHSWLLRQISTMTSDPWNQGILLYVNSPGGAVYQTDELYLKLQNYQKKTKRPLYAYFSEYAASGGYYIAAGADKINANRNCITGSIGVYTGPVLDASALLDRLGIHAEYIKSGENKAMGNAFTPMTEEQRQIYQDYVDEAYDQFVGIVAQGRKLDEETVRTIADGRIYTARQAAENGLIDEVSDFQTAKKEMLKDQKLDCEFETFRYKPQTSFYSRFFQAADRIGQALEHLNRSEEESLLRMLEENQSITIRYQLS